MVQPIHESDIVRKLGNSEHLVFLDIGPTKEYDHAHLPGALHLERDDLPRLASQYVPDHGKQVVVYDDGGGREAWKAARELARQGYLQIYVYEGGREEWLRDTRNTQAHINPAPGTQNPNFNPVTVDIPGVLDHPGY